MTEADVISAVRFRCGKITEAMGELDDDDIVQENTWILRKIADRIQIKKLRSFTGEEDEREYDVHADTLRVQKVFQWDENENETYLNDPDKTGYPIGSYDADEYYNWPSLWKIEMYRRERGLPRIKFEWDPINKKIILDPAPSSAGDTYWYISVEKSKWTLTGVPEDFEEMMITGTSWRCLESVALRRSVGRGGAHRAGGYVDYPEARLKRFSDDWKKEFFEELDLKAKIYSR